MKRTLITAAVALAAAVALWFTVQEWGQVNDRIQELETAVAVRDVRIATLTARKDTAEANLGRARDSLAAANLLREGIAAEAEELARQANERLHETIAELDLSEQQREIIEAHLAGLNAAYQAQIAQKDTIIQNLDLLIVQQDHALQEHRRLNAELQAQLRDSEELADLWKREARPGIIGSLTRDLPQKIVAFGVGYAAGAL